MAYVEFDPEKNSGQFRKLIWREKKTKLVVTRGLIRLWCAGDADDRRDVERAAEKLRLWDAIEWINQRKFRENF